MYELTHELRKDLRLRKLGNSSEIRTFKETPEKLGSDGKSPVYPAKAMFRQFC